jgi:hypothetical protein
MDNQPGQLIRIRFKQSGDDLITATSDDLPGLFLAYPRREQIISDLPEAVAVLFKKNYDQDVRVFVLDSPTDPEAAKQDSIPLAAINAALLRDFKQSGG